MAENQTQIQVAIMFTDLVGYTALSERDEPAALELVKKNRELHTTTIQKHNGQLVKELGDGFMATFENAFHAIACARDIQGKAKALDFGLPIRVGIHFGEITTVRGDIFGHGVNMASRIQTIADPGGVYLSEAMNKIIVSKTDPVTQYMGAVPLKNIKDPVPVYALKGEGLTSPDKKRINRIIRRSVYLRYYRNAAIVSLLVLAVLFIWFKQTFVIERNIITKSVAVLSLKNLTKDTGTDFLSISLTEELIRELSRVNTLTVISQSSTIQYSGIGITFSEISRALNDVNYIVDGTVLMENDQIQLEIRLNDPTKDQVIWRKEYATEVSASRQLWADVAKDICRTIGVFVPDENSTLWSGIKSVDPGTYELYLKGMHALNKDSINPEVALSYFNEAIEKSPTDAYAWAGVATAHIFMGHGTHPSKEDRQKARAAALRAIQLDSTLAEAWSSLGMVKGYYDWDWNEAEYAYRKANELNPSLAWNHYHYSWYLVLFGRMDEAIREHKKAKELDPFTPAHTAWLGYLYMMVGEYDKAIKEAELAMKMKNKILGKLVLGEIYCSMGKTAEGIEIFEEILSNRPDIPEHFFPFIGKAYLLTGNIEKGMKILNEIDTKYDINPSAWGALQRAAMYTALGDYDNAFKWYQFEPHHHWVSGVRVLWNMPFAKDSSFVKDPRFNELMQRMDLPDPAPFQYNAQLDQ